MERSPVAPTFVGIDVAKDRLDVHLRPADQAFAVSRDGAGLEALAARLIALAPALVVLEATGGFEITVAGALAAAGLPLVVVNPRQIHDFARATGRLAKTDRLDAEAVARFAEAIRPAPRPVTDAAAQALGELVARRRQLVEMITSEGQRRRQTRDPRLGRRLEAHVSWWQKELATLETDLDDAVRGTPAWRAADDYAGDRQDLGPHLDRRAARARPPRPPPDRSPWSGSRRSTATAAPVAVAAWSWAAAPASALPWTCRPWPSATILRCEPSTSA